MLVTRDAGLEDIPVIRALAHEIWEVAYKNILSRAQLDYMLRMIYSPASLRNQFLNLEHTFILILAGDVPIGFASYSPKEKNSNTYRLHKIYILPDQQGSGAGEFLLNFVIKATKAAGGTSLELNVNRHNKAKTFYEKQGFIAEKEVDIDIGNGFFMNDYVMRLKF